jgi:nucleotide-binding universal stress UspA family protein
MSKAKQKKIIWAVDPYGDAKVQASAASLAHSLSLHSDVEVVYVHGTSGLPFEVERVRKESVRFGLSRAQDRLNKMLSEFKYKPKKKPHILAHESVYVRMDVKTLVSYAKKKKADAVLVSTNAKTGFMRQVLGSFSETLVLESAIPTMIVNPKAKVDTKPGVILFPTDFSNLSWKAFQQVVSFARSTNASIKLFHQYWGGEAQDVPSDVSYFKDDRWLEGDSLLDEDLQKIKKTLLKWLAFAKKQNVKCSHEIKFGLRNIADATLELAKKENTWMIAMATVTGPLAATFIGSNARWIVRSANCPVWVLYVEGK